MNSLPISDSNKSTECMNSENSKLPRGLVGMKGLPIAKGTRLPSLRGPRDLTLGGTAKRIFTPNVSQCKERSKYNEEELWTQEGLKYSQKSMSAVAAVTMSGRGGKNKQRIKEHVHRRSKNREFIQTQGVVFGEGLVGIKTKPELSCQRSGKGYSRSDRKTSPKFASNINRNDDKKMKEFIKDDCIDSDEDIDEKLFPTILPISNRSGSLHPKNLKKKWVGITAEEDESLSDCHLSKDDKSLNNANKLRQMSLEVFDVNNLPESGKLLLFQFPDCLPALKENPDVATKMESAAEVSGSPQKKKGNSRKKETSSSSTLADWPEGYLGKLRIHKSGKTYLVIGSLILDINISTSFGFLQELVSLRIKKNTGDMTVLGHVNEKVVCVPNTEALLASCS